MYLGNSCYILHVKASNQQRVCGCCRLRLPLRTRRRARCWPPRRPPRPTRVPPAPQPSPPPSPTIWCEASHTLSFYIYQESLVTGKVLSLGQHLVLKGMLSQYQPPDVSANCPHSIQYLEMLEDQMPDTRLLVNMQVFPFLTSGSTALR